MSLNRSDSCLDIAGEKQELMDLLFYGDLKDDGHGKVKSPKSKGIDSIIKWSKYDDRHWPQEEDFDNLLEEEDFEKFGDLHPNSFKTKPIIKNNPIEYRYLVHSKMGNILDIIQDKPPKKKKSVVFRDPLCEVRLYDKVAAKRQQWGHATKFSRVKRFCWDKEVENLHGSKDDLWLLDEPDEEYRRIIIQDMVKRRMNRKRRQNGENLEYMVQRLEISTNCVEVVTSKMRRMTK